MNNRFGVNRGHSWGRGQPRPYPRDQKKESFAEVRSETAKLDEVLRRLQREVEELETLKEKRLLQDKKSEDLFLRWGGIALHDATENKCRVTFTPPEPGETYQIGFEKVDQCWGVSFYNLPFCMSFIRDRVAALNIDSIEKLCLFVRTLQSEIDVVNRRAKQFSEAMILSSPALRIFPAVATTAAMLEIMVNDSVGSDLSRISVHLTYLPDKFLPEEPFFVFRGGDKTAEQEFKKQLACLQYMPLKEALECAFSLDEVEAEQKEQEEEKQVSKDEIKPEDSGKPGSLDAPKVVARQSTKKKFGPKSKTSRS
ncbi:hypothetical protein FOCC_FOCC006700 [Frankliniella occidentalis]|uniref:Uncharacterized protein LOC113216753 n=1 Tax=Frankliniella occidentalis TaxID=133901 RepID=A0A6J1TGE1_FRAOC|nr:uncharacterized protein LOC113216753 [Frankliniella occidentalis]KAE8746586.1 hypothetical protein FOCC_FOCC006700 [Frankliniella occidentalis]